MKTQSAIINPVTLPPRESWTPAEEKFVECMVAGEPCFISENLPPKPIKEGKDANVIRADMISFFAHGGDKNYPRGRNIIRLQGAWVEDELLLLFSDISPCTLGFHSCRFPRAVVMLHAKCDAFYMTGCHLATGLAGDGMEVNGNLSLDQGFASDGGVRLLNARVRNNLYLGGGSFKAKGVSLAADGIKVKGNVMLFYNEPHDKSNDNEIQMNVAPLLEKGFCAEGQVLLPDADIGGSFYCGGGYFKNGLEAQGMKIKNTLLWRDVRGQGTVNLSAAAAGALVDEEKSHTGFKFNLVDFSYNRLVSNDNIQSRINWLDNRPDGIAFSKRPFEQAAKVFATMGISEGAREILFAMEKRVTKTDGFPKWGDLWLQAQQQIKKWQQLWARTFAYKCWSLAKRIPWVMWRKLWEVTTGYNYRLGRIFMTSALIILAGAEVYKEADNRGYIVAHQPIVLANADYKKIVRNEKPYIAECPSAWRKHLRPTEAARCLFPGYPRFDALSFSADIFIPFFALHQEPFWYPQPPKGTSTFIQYSLLGWYWFQVLAGWVLTSVLVLTITGILQQRQAGWGGK